MENAGFDDDYEYEMGGVADTALGHKQDDSDTYYRN